MNRKSSNEPYSSQTVDVIMEIEEIYKRLCSYDPRNPNFYLDDEDAREHAAKTPENCTCDNCFYGRTSLALEIIRLKSLLKSVTGVDDTNK